MPHQKINPRVEQFFGKFNLAFLIGVEPRSYMLLAGQVEEGCDGETWGLSRALVNGHRQFRSEAEFALALIAELIADDEKLRALADKLLNILERVYTPGGRETDDWLEALGYPADA